MHYRIQIWAKSSSRDQSLSGSHLSNRERNLLIRSEWCISKPHLQVSLMELVLSELFWRTLEAKKFWTCLRQRCSECLNLCECLNPSLRPEWPMEHLDPSLIPNVWLQSLHVCFCLPILSSLVNNTSWIGKWILGKLQSLLSICIREWFDSI